MTDGIAAIITCRELGRTLLEALSSVEHQSRPAAEIVVVDDGSSQIYTQQVLARLMAQGVRVAQAGGRGASAARNLGARLTSAEMIVWLDADDILEPTYFEKAGAVLDTDTGLDFVSCAIRAFGEAAYVWTPASPTLVDVLSNGAWPHASTMMRRRLWDAVCGFDETLPWFELLDFWTTALAHGARGTVLDEPLLLYRIRAGSRYRHMIQPATYVSRLAHFYAKHRTAIEPHGLAIIEGKEAFLLGQRDYHQALEARAAALERELAQLQSEIADTARRLASHGAPRIGPAELASVQPLSRQWGRDRGTAIDRRYIERFLETHRADIRGRVLEVRQPMYTEMFGGQAVEARDVIDIDPTNPAATCVADLRHAAPMPSDAYDCIILTQTLHLIDDMPAVLAECARMLRPGGVLLVTVPSVSKVDNESGLDGDFWRLTEASARKLFAAAFPVDHFDVEAHGNVRACAAFLYGMSAEEVAADDLEYADPAFPLVIAIRAVKPDDVSQARSASLSGSWSLALKGQRSSGAILCYHRVAELTPDSHALCLPPEEFRAHMTCLAREFNPIGLDELVRAAASGRIPERAVAVTLDDGYLDALTTASPILADAGVPATFFVNTDRLDEPHERWWDVLERVFLSDAALPARLELRVNGNEVLLGTATAAERTEALDALNRQIWPLDAHARAKMLDDVLAWSGASRAPRQTHRVMTADEVRALARRSGHTIGAHSVHHLSLTLQPAETKQREIVGNRIALEQLVGRPITLFSYPYGECDAATIAAVGEAGFHAAVTVDAGLVSSGTNRLLLPRYEISARQPGDFASRLRAIFDACVLSR